MSGSPVPIPVISSAGITLPTYNQVLLGYQQGYASVYGVDVSLEPDDIDGQWIAIQAQAYFDLSQMIGVIYNMFGVTTATGPFLDNLCALADIQRQAATNSTAVVTIVGVAGTLITNGVVGDNQNLGTQWDLPATVTIPSGGSIPVTATCVTAGAVLANATTLTQILTPTAGWQTVSNPVAAIPGAAIETDAQLVQAQQTSTANASETTMQTIAGAVANVSGVSAINYFNNDTNSTVNGVPAGSFALIVAGGSVSEIAAAIASKKPPGIPSFGTTSAIVFDTNGVPDTMNWYELSLVEVIAQITLQPLNGYVATTGQSIQNSVQNFINAYDPGQELYVNDLFAPAKINNTYTITGIEIALYGNTLGLLNLTPLIYQQFFANLADISIVVL